MIAAIRQRYIGPDVQGRQVSGLILGGGHYDQSSAPLDYELVTDVPGGKPDVAFIPAGIVHEHLDNLKLVESMEADRE